MFFAHTSWEWERVCEVEERIVTRENIWREPMFIDRFSYCVVAVQFRSCDDSVGRLQIIIALFLHVPPCNQLHVTNFTIVASQMRYHMELGNRMQIWQTTRSAPGTSCMNLVIARDELHESEASEASVFCFDNASPEKSCFVDGLVCFTSLCLRVFEFLNATRREWNLPLEREVFFSFPVRLWGEDRRSNGVHDCQANCKTLFATFQARIS